MNPQPLHSSDTVNILTCADSRFFQHLAVMLVSLLKCNSDLTIKITLVTQDAAVAETERLTTTISAFGNAQLIIKTLEISDKVQLRTRDRYTRDIYSRLWVADFFGQDISRVLYLDADMVIIGSIRELWNQDLEGNILGAVTIPGSARVRQLGLSPEFGYFNSGVLLIDLNQWRQSRALDKVLSILRDYGSQFNDPDQDALNMCFSAQRKILEYKWNVQMAFYYPYHNLEMSSNEISNVKQTARIIHFNGKVRPWSYYSLHPHKATYYASLALTEWRDYTPPDYTFKDMIKKNLWPLLPLALRTRLRRLLRIDDRDA